MTDTMHALRLHRIRDADGAEDFRVDEVPRPEPAPTEVLVEVAACGVGGADLAVARGAWPSAAQLPRILGHEAAGTVAAVGAEVTDWQRGDRVALLMSRACRTCRYCAVGRDNLCTNREIPGITTDGALAGFTAADQDHLVPVPLDVPFHEAAIVTDAVATPYHAIKRAGLAEGSTLVVLGLGGIGMHAVLLAKLWGAEVIGVDLDPVNLARATAWGADAVVDAREHDVIAQVRTLTSGGADRSLECVGTADVAQQAVDCVAPGGRAVLVGRAASPTAGLPTARLVADEVEVAGSTGSSMQDVGELFDLLEDQRLDLTRSVTDTTDLAGVGSALACLETREGHPVRTVVTDLR